MNWYPFRVGAGFVSKAILQGNSTYLLSNYPRQDDQPAYVPWLLKTPVLEDGFRRGVGMNQYAKFFGSSTVTLVVPIMTPGMFDYWINRFFTTGAQTAPITFEIPDKRLPEDDQATVIQGLMQKPTRDGLNLVRGRFWQDVNFIVEGCSILP